jgi:hypothetical protein
LNGRICDVDLSTCSFLVLVESKDRERKKM